MVRTHGLWHMWLALLLLLMWGNVSSGNDQSVRYDKNVNLFSASGELLQVQYARNAGLRGSSVLCSLTSSGEAVVCMPTTVTLQTLQDRRTVDKLAMVCDGVWFTFAGLAGDGRALLKAARSFGLEYQSKFGSSPTARSVARYIGDLQHECTLTGGRRPFGVQVLLIGEDASDGKLCIYNSEPSGEISTWRAAAIGKNADKNMRRLEEALVTSLPTADTAAALTKLALADQPLVEDEEGQATHSEQEKVEKPTVVDLYRFHRPGTRAGTGVRAGHNSIVMSYYGSVEELVRGLESEAALP